MKSEAKIFRFCGYNQLHKPRAKYNSHSELYKPKAQYKLDAKNRKINFDYSVEFTSGQPLRFRETIILPKTPPNLKDDALNKFLEPLSLVLGISYFKLYCPPQITTSFPLSKEQADFFNTVYKKGLGEFFYRNRLDPEKLAKFPYSTVKVSPKSFKIRDRALLGIGGGKDSIVTAELLRDFKSSLFLVETQREDLISERVAQEIGTPLLKIKRILDPKIFKLSQSGYSGHIPISAIYAFLGLLLAALYQYKYVMVGNEHSSDFGNLDYQGEIINHQWSKSSEFEELLKSYTRQFITKDIIYFSPLRQFNEIRVAQTFAQHKKYFPVFTSCNTNFRVFKERPNFLWCGKCPKCAFTFLILAPFISKTELLKIFKKNLLADKQLIPLFRDLLGFGKLKPFDCVGTFEEAQAALYLASKKFKEEAVVRNLLVNVKNPKNLKNKVFRTNYAPTIPTPFRFLGIKNVCILGYGKEGRITEKYLRKNYPHLKIGILDKRLSKNYLAQQERFDLLVKSSGIPRSKVKIPYVTATNIFFSQNRNFTIGVTGSKGKSTTASLIYEILKSSGKKVRLIGNIGRPMLEVLLKKIDDDEILVIELSSYMLEDIEYSPNIAVLLNLFPEHMDYHGGVENYYRAKNNIFKFQKSNDSSIHPPFNEKIPLKKGEIPLLGPHNLKNIQAAIAVARIFDIPDSVIKRAIKNFKPLAHRLEFIGEFQGIKFYDDAISTTPESTIMAIKTLGNIGTIFLGGEDRGYDFRKLEGKLRRFQIRNVVLFPNSGDRILRSKRNFNILKTQSMKDAVKFAFQVTPKGQICLLSTASPSYSLWENFEEKGNLFQYFVKKYGGDTGSKLPLRADRKINKPKNIRN